MDQSNQVITEENDSQKDELENKLNENITDKDVSQNKTDIQHLKDNCVEATRADDNNSLANLQRNLPVEPYDFIPNPPRRVLHSVILSTAHLARRIYLEMLRAISAYGELEDIATDADKQEINNLQNQMQILSISMLGIYRSIARNPRAPLLTSRRTALSRDYQTAIQQMYDRVHHIHNLVGRLLLRTDDQFRATLIIIFTNLKSQLRTLDALKN